MDGATLAGTGHLFCDAQATRAAEADARKQVCRFWFFEDHCREASAAVEAEDLAQSKADAEASYSYAISTVLLCFECIPMSVK